MSMLDVISYCIVQIPLGCLLGFKFQLGVKYKPINHSTVKFHGQWYSGSTYIMYKTKVTFGGDTNLCREYDMEQ